MNRKILYLLIIFLLQAFVGMSQTSYPPLVRLHAYADVTFIKHGQYQVTLFLEIYNYDKKYPVVIEGITAKAWRGTTEIKPAEDWLQSDKQFVVMQNQKQRVIQRSFFVNKEPPLNRWTRWLQFTATTNRGQFKSNLVATPYSFNVTQE
jgi:hypothetical protein